MKLLYAEDEKDLATAVSEILKMEGFDVDNVFDGIEAWGMLQDNIYDACVFDIMMPGMDGIELLSKMRANNMFTPVLMLTAKVSIEDKIEGLESGADDYLCKPFEVKELVARLNSMIRRSSAAYRSNAITFGNLKLNCDTRELSTENSSLILNSKEVDLLTLLIKNEQPLSAKELNSKIIMEKSGEKATKLYISYLQHKLSQVNADVFITSSREGYSIERRILP